MTGSKQFYVYTLARPDGRVFYVGKGKGDRMHVHEGEAFGGCGCPKCQVIHEVWSGGGSVVKSVAFESFNEDDVLQRERDTIAAIGRENLCNRSDGGEGRSYASPFKQMYEEYLGWVNYEIWNARRSLAPGSAQRCLLWLDRKQQLERWHESYKLCIENAKRQAANAKKRYDSRWEKSIAPPW